MRLAPMRNESFDELWSEEAQGWGLTKEGFRVEIVGTPRVWGLRVESLGFWFRCKGMEDLTDCEQTHVGTRVMCLQVQSLGCSGGL